MSADAATTAILEAYAPSVVARGRAYAKEGRVELVAVSNTSVTARVTGTEPYEVSISLDVDAPIGDCTCPAFDRAGECKHVAALAWALKRERPEVPLLPALERLRSAPVAGVVPLPPIFANVYSATTFFERVSLYAREPLRERPGWQPLADWWRRNANTPGKKRIRDAVVVAAAEVEAVTTQLASWRPPAAPIAGTAYADLFDGLTRIYVEWVGEGRARKVRQDLPGPLDDRHPGFDLQYDGTARTLSLREKIDRQDALRDQVRLVAQLPIVPGGEITFGSSYYVGPADWDAWHVFALRELLIRLEQRKTPALAPLIAELSRPAWECVLVHIEAEASEPAAREWTFAISSTYGSEHRLAVFARGERHGKPGKWKKEKFESLFEGPAAELEREIARVALCSLRERNEAVFALGTPQGHALVQLLARHPRAVFTDAPRANPESDQPVDFIVGEVTMRLEPDEVGELRPVFLAAGREIPIDVLAGDSMFRGARRAGEDGERDRIYSLVVPRALGRWIAAALEAAQRLRFPTESIDRLVASAQPLVEAGVVELPRSALGRPRPYQPRVGMRVEWQADGAAAKLELLVSVAPGAPLLPAGFGPKVFTYVDAGERVHVERDIDREAPLVAAAMGRIEAPVHWSFFQGLTDGIEDTLMLGDYLDRNPHDLVVEVKVGKRPSVAAWGASGRLGVRKRGAWLALDGEIAVEDVKLSLQDILEAVRLTRRYVRAADGLFLELSSDAIAKLRPVAVAAELAPAGKGLHLHEAFGDAVVGITDLFDSVKPVGVDLDELAMRFEKSRRPAEVPPLESGGSLRSYQRDGVAWMLGLARWAPGCVLADDMGLGKTVQTASVLKARAALGPALIVAPASVTANWLSELARFMPSLRLQWFNEQRTSDARAAVLSEVGVGDVLIVSYGLLQRSSADFGAKRWATVVVDEAQYLKNVEAQRTDAVRALERTFTIALTGTPLENHLGELYSIVSVAFPGLLGDEARFRERFRRPIESKKDPDRLATLSRLVAPFLLRRTRAEVLQELPAREEIVEHVELAQDERAKYLALRKACEEQFAKRKRAETPAQLRIALLAALTRLRQLACDVRLVEPEFDGASTKLTRAVDLARQVAAEGNAVLVFSQFTQYLGMVETAMRGAGLRVCSLTGDTPLPKRRIMVEEFQAGGYDVFCISLLAGGTGLNLTRASYVIHLDPWWNPAAEEQATSRAHRMGQTVPVTVYRLVARGTIEEAVLEMHAAKRELAAAVLDGKAKPSTISPDDLAALLRFGD